MACGSKEFESPLSRFPLRGQAGAGSPLPGSRYQGLPRSQEKLAQRVFRLRKARIVRLPQHRKNAARP